MARRIKVRTSRPWDNSLSDDPKVLRIAVRALEEKLRKVKLELTAANEMIQSYRRALEGKTGASRPSPEHHPSRNTGADQSESRAVRRANLLARAVEGIEERRPEPPPLPPRPSTEDYENPSDGPRVVRDEQGRVLEQNEVFENMSDRIMAQMRRRDLFVEKMRIGAIMLALLGVAVGLFFFDAQAFYEWFTRSYDQ